MNEGHKNNNNSTIDKYVDKLLSDHDYLKALNDYIELLEGNHDEKKDRLHSRELSNEQKIAQEIYEKSLLEDPTSSVAHHNYACFLEFTLEDFDKAKLHYIKAIQSSQKHIESYINLSWLYFERFDDYKNAKLVLENALKYNDDNADIYANLGLFAIKGPKDFYLGETYLLKAYDLNDKDEKLCVNLGELYFMKQDFINSKKYFERAIEVNPDNSNVLAFLGIFAFMYENDADFALDYFLKALKIDPEYGQLYYIIGELFVDYYNDYDKAIEFFNQALEYKLDPVEKAVVHYVMGEVYYNNLHDIDNALRSYEEAYGLKEFAFIEKKLLMLYEEKKQFVH